MPTLFFTNLRKGLTQTLGSIVASLVAPVRRNSVLFLICLTSAGWAFSFGLSAPLISLWLDHAGCSKSVIGWNTGVYYLAMAVAAALVPSLMRRVGILCPVFGMVLAGVTVAAFPWGDGIAWWFSVRVLNGLAGALCVIPLETYVNRDAAETERARNFGFYAVAITLGWALGNGVGLQLAAEWPQFAFALGGSVALLAGGAVWVWLPRFHEPQSSGRERTPLNFRQNLLSYGSAWNQGFLEGGMVAFLPLYLLTLSLTEHEVGWLTSATMIGVIAFQIPVAWLADLLGRSSVLLACYGVVVASLFVLPWCGPSQWLVLWLFLVGACSGAFYPLGLALLGERMPNSALARANAWYLAIECLGCWVGPSVMGAIIDTSGSLRDMFLTANIVLIAFLAVWFTFRLLQYRHEKHAEASKSHAPDDADREAA